MWTKIDFIDNLGWSTLAAAHVLKDYANELSWVPNELASRARTNGEQTVASFGAFVNKFLTETVGAVAGAAQRPFFIYTTSPIEVPEV